jgi:hypothetical protein
MKNGPDARRALWLTRTDAELLASALEYWSTRLDVTDCKSAPHIHAAAFVRQRIAELRPKVAELFPVAAKAVAKP